MQYLQGGTNKEALAQQHRLRDGTAPSGWIGAFSTLENGTSDDVYRNAKAHRIDRRRRKGRHDYFYFDDERFGPAQVRLQTGSPFNTNVVLNGREWLARQLDKEGLGYQRRDNGFTWVEDRARPRTGRPSAANPPGG